MAKEKSKLTKNGAAIRKNGTNGASRAYEIAGGSLRTGPEFAELISALISDVVRGSLAPPVLTATCNGVGKLLKMVELRHKYGGGKSLQLT